MRLSLPTLRGRRVNLLPDPAGLAGALAAVTAEAAAYVDSGPVRAARADRRVAARAAATALTARHGQPQDPADWRWSLNSCPANDA
jgi:hypothetical protein